MWNLNHVVHIEHRGDYRYFVAFDDGCSGEIDFSCYLNCGPVFQPLRDKVFFASAKVEGGTISWPNGADIAPETLYAKVAEVNNHTMLSHCEFGT